MRQAGAMARTATAVGAGAWVAAGLAVGFIVVLVAGAVPAGAVTSDYGPRVDIWTDRGTGGMYRVGEPIQVCIRPYEDCYVMVYEIDTDGYLRVLFPRDCDRDAFLEGGVTYTIGGGWRNFYVTGPSGVEYVHVVASYDPFREIYWHGCSGYSRYALNVTWQGFHDYWGSALPPRVYGDPYMAMQSIDEFICMDALASGMASADFTYFYVGERVHYPRYLCYDCHGFSSHVRPYVDVCAGFSISFVDCDRSWSPWSWWWWCSPTQVYCGPRYVCHRAGQGCGGHHGGRHGCDDLCINDSGRWPAEYKWKSRHDGAGLGGPGQRHASPGDRRAAAPRVGNSGDGERYKADERSLYSRGESRKAVERVRRVSSDRGAGGGREALRPAEPNQVERRQAAPRQEIERRDRKESGKREKGVLTRLLGSSGVRSVVGSVVSGGAKRAQGDDKRSSDTKPKGKAPQMRRGDEGKSHSARRTLSK